MDPSTRKHSTSSANGFDYEKEMEKALGIIFQNISGIKEIRHRELARLGSLQENASRHHEESSTDEFKQVTKTVPNESVPDKVSEKKPTRTETPGVAVKRRKLPQPPPR